MDFEEVAAAIETAFHGVPRPTMQISDAVGSVDDDNIRFFEKPERQDDNYGQMLHGTYALRRFSDEAFVYFLPRILNASLKDRFRYGPILDEFLLGFSGEVPIWRDQLSHLSADQLDAILKWLLLLENANADYKGVQFDSAVGYISILRQNY